mgnify:CR=1 FL=1
MKKLGIIQPGKIGDIIICLPIAKWYSDRGWKVIWPVHVDIIKNFVGYVDYVEFIPLNDFNCMAAHQICFQNSCNRVIDLAFTLPGANAHNSDWYLNHNDSLSFDEMKYAIAEVPFEEKWNLKINRNERNERNLYETLRVKNTPYTLYQDQSSDTSSGLSKIFRLNRNPNGLQKIDSTTDSIFDWVRTLEEADQHILIESCFSNLVDQLQIVVPEQILLLKHGYYGAKLKDGHLKGIPRLKLNWKTI